ncbi:hypothetical protein SAMN02745116_02345 [Pilibacter termitis]|uniref:Uncharacterized protein n=1 Tax=Pilibacter termitis TaxID=263852 RepID=A0A1T4QVW3_9ENTE|nr:hypothetical protein [Pilibacter termitis]SKA07873.1 hypothetical protein SAMN02745116_02345 [Pilibacter termitis]
MELVMPAHYVEMEEEEMMYVDGGRVNIGKHWWNSRGFISNVLDTFLALFIGYRAIRSGQAGVKILLKSGYVKKKLREKAIGMLGYSVGSVLFATALSILGTWTGLTVGSIIAGVFDWADGSYNGYVAG